ncbi:uncharacterized protein H6S33_009977 [Morchella sextelata]|uniref:uncharacterized protein n=1 Tax=Morchella sextelata TaxID=1174677 RepID=UPI001D05352F|nr:uncharacterized protein H6S33_009977 [Morchella sextelata]KAH0611925.1 hypothetical protein H6S33_009977 [Morchella sextelata]
MHFPLLSALLVLSPSLQALVAGSPLLTEKRTTEPSCNSDNPFLNHVQYANTGYATKLEETIQSFLADGDELNAARTRTVQGVSTFMWVSSSGDIPSLSARLDEAIRAQRRPPNKKLIFPLVIYNLPDRDCSAKASAGELSLADGGLEKYKTFIDTIATALSAPPYDRLDYAIVLEPDSLGNVITNLATAPACVTAAPGYLAGLSYAIQKLQRDNIALYIDAAHSNWLGWPSNLEPAAKVFKQVVDGAGSGAKIRGFATNVSNYNAYNATVPDVIYGPGPDNPNWSELKYAKALAPYLEAEGLPSKFIIDQGRSGAQNIRTEGGHWCNIKDAGYGTRPTTDTGECIVDSIVWVKPGGESDGTSDTSAARFDANCVSEDADVPAPEAGSWFNDFVKRLVINANPPLEPTYV